MKFYITADIAESSYHLSHQSRIFCLGSCFADNMGKKMSNYKFEITTNPLGIVYNPESIKELVERISNNTPIAKKELQSCQDYYCHLDFHGQFNRLNPEDTVYAINTAIEKTNAFASKELDCVILTLGTAYAYRHIHENRIVNNCHKLPSVNFERILLNPDRIYESLQHTIQTFKKDHPQVRFIITVSPIRHLRDGWIKNSRSKAHLLTAAHQLAEKEASVDYFPAYEIMLDELRDHRFYTKDLIHPSEEAIDYIWDRFRKSYFSEETDGLIKKLEQIQRDLNHRPFLKKSEGYQKLLASTQMKIDELSSNHSFLNLEEESRMIEDLKRK